MKEENEKREKRKSGGRVRKAKLEVKFSKEISIAGLFLKLLRPMRACSPTLAHLVLPRLSRTPSSTGTERASSMSGRRGPAFVAATASASTPSSPQPPRPHALPFDGSARRGGLLHPRFGDPSPTPPEGETAPPVRASQQRCSRCGGELSVSWLEGRWRHACVGGGGSVAGEAGGAGCGTIAYANPLLVVGAIVTDVDDALSPGEGGEKDDGGKGMRKRKPKVLLVKRAIEPRKGSWTLPAGYLELGESAAEGAARETWEEARARVEIFGPYFHAVSEILFFSSSRGR